MTKILGPEVWYVGLPVGQLGYHQQTYKAELPEDSLVLVNLLVMPF
jgi:hypothetical protein